MGRKKSVILFIIMLGVYFVVCFGIGIASVIYSVNAGLSNMDLPEYVKVIIGIVGFFVFCPFLGVICRIAKQESVKPIYVISLVLQILIYICVLSEIVPIIRTIWMH